MRALRSHTDPESHRQRCVRKLSHAPSNAECKLKPHVFIKEDSNIETSQDCYLAIGTPLIACKTIENRGLFNSAHYTVVNLDPLTIQEESTNAREAGQAAEDIVITVNEFPRLLRLAYAITAMSSQGKTIQGRVVIHEWNSIHFTRKHLNVSISRATHHSLVTFAD